MIVDPYGRPIDPTLLVRPEQRSDGWQNEWTGIGTEADKLTHGRFFPTERVMDQQLRSLRDGSDLIARIVEDGPRELFREGYALTGKIRKEKKSGNPTDAATDVLESDVEDLREYAQEQMQLDDLILEGVIEGRYWGGCLDVMGIDDGGFPWEPLNEDRIRSFDYLTLVDRRYAYVQSQYSRMLEKQAGAYGTAEIYLVSNAVAASGWDEPGASVKKRTPRQIQGGGGNIQFVHSSRVLRFDGNPADVQTRQRLAGWSWSVIQRIYAICRMFEHAFDSCGYMLSEASLSVYKLQNLVRAITARGRAEILARASLMEQTVSVMHGRLLDAGGSDGKGEESYERVNIPFGGVSDLIDRFMMRISVGADNMPVSRLFGKSPQGLNATGDSEIRTWYDGVRGRGQKKVAPLLKRTYRLLALSPKSPMAGKKVDWAVEFNPLWSPTDLETAQAQLANAQRDTIYVNDGTITAEENALNLRDVYPHLDFDAREVALKAAKTLDLHKNDPPDLGQGGAPLGGAPIPTMGPAKSPEAGGKGVPGPKSKSPKPAGK